MDLITDYLSAVFTLIAESAPYFLVGLTLAGILKVAIPTKKVVRHLGGDDMKSVGLAALFGIPLPLCSCSVLPTAMALRKSGASRGATTSFMISTPETGVDSISLTWALLDPIMTVARPLSALITALLTGSVVNSMVKGGKAGEATEEDACCGSQQENGIGNGDGVLASLRRGTSYSFGTLMDDLSPWLIVGFLLSGIITVAVPDDFFTETIPGGWIAGLIILALATPMYICAAAATPLAAALIAKGLDPGAALVLLLVGPATNVTTAIVVGRFLGKRVLIAYLAGVVGCALILGAIVSAIYKGEGLDLATQAAATIEDGPSTVGIFAAAVLIVLLARGAVRSGAVARVAGTLRALLAPIGIDPTSRAAKATLVVVLVLIYASTGFSLLGPGETGWVQRFGRVVRTVDEPGLVVHWPAPVERLETLRRDEVRGVNIGFAALRADAQAAAQAEVLTGDENLLWIAWSVQYSVRAAFRFRYRVEDPETLVVAFAETAIREVVGRRPATEVLVGHRPALERETLEILSRELTALGAGIRVVAVRLEDVHSAPEAHAAFRDVASAMEDMKRAIRHAEGYRLVRLAAARGDGYTLEVEAESYGVAKVESADGEARGFLARWAAYEEEPELTRLRLLFDAAEDALSSARAIFLLGGEVSVDLWNLRSKAAADPEQKEPKVAEAFRRVFDR